MRKKCLCVIPARGGSKRIPRKNIRPFLGKPILAYPICEALDSYLFSNVVVSTDDNEIANIAMSFGAEVPFFRSSQNSTDFASTIDVLLEVIGDFEKLGKHYEYICCIYPTAVFLKSKMLITALDYLINGDCNCVFPVIPFSYPIQRSLIRTENGKIKMAYPEFLNARSQDLEKHYHDAGQFYFASVEAVKKENRLFVNNSLGIVLSEMEAQDIDTIDDWKLAELKYSLFINEN